MLQAADFYCNYTLNTYLLLHDSAKDLLTTINSLKHLLTGTQYVKTILRIVNNTKINP